MTGRPTSPLKQERDGVAARTLVALALTTGLISAVAVVISSRLQRAATGELARREPVERAPHTIGVVEQTLIGVQEDGLLERRLAERELHQYGWVDRARGVVRLPIEEAMSRYVAEHAHDAWVRP